MSIRVFVAAIVVALGGAQLATWGEHQTVCAREAETHRVTTVGTLKKNPSKDSKDTPYVLTDPRGKIRYHLKADEDLDLSGHLGQRVSVSGRGYFDPNKRRLDIHVDRVHFRERVTNNFHRVAHLEEPISDPIPEPVANPEYLGSSSRSEQDEIIVQPEVTSNGVIDTSSCNSCGGRTECDQCTDGFCCTCCGPQHWLRTEYLLWWADGMRTPPLLTTADEVEDLPLPNGEILYGANKILQKERSGGRIRFGTWFDCNSTWGIEGDYLGLDKKGEQFIEGCDSDGLPFLGRPFFNVNPRDNSSAPLTAQEDAELVCAPGRVSGTIGVHTLSDYHSSGARFRWNLCQNEFCSPESGEILNNGRWRLDLLLGYRFGRLRESLGIREDLTSIEESFEGDIDLRDRFMSRNEFHGGEIGANWEYQRGCWSLDLLGRLALGNNHQQVDIDGVTSSTPLGGSKQTFRGGLLAQESNIGHYEQDEFNVVPELSATVGFRLADCLRFTTGYTFIYWSQVVRPGDLIDRNINGDFLNTDINGIPSEGGAKPAFVFRDADFWLHGVNFGLHYDF